MKFNDNSDFCEQYRRATFRSSIVERISGIFERYKKRGLCQSYFVARLPKELHQKIAEIATAQGVSLNQWVNQALSREVMA